MYHHAITHPLMAALILTDKMEEGVVCVGGGDVYADVLKRLYGRRENKIVNVDPIDFSIFSYIMAQRGGSSSIPKYIKIPSPASQVRYSFEAFEQGMYFHEMKYWCEILAQQPNRLIPACTIFSLILYEEVLAVLPKLTQAIANGEFVELADLSVILPACCEIKDHHEKIGGALKQLYAVMTPQTLPNLRQLTVTVLSSANAHKTEVEKTVAALLPQLSALTLLLEDAESLPAEIDRRLMEKAGQHLVHFAVHTHSAKPSVAREIALLSYYIEQDVLPALQCLTIGQPKQNGTLPSIEGGWARLGGAEAIEVQMSALIKLFDITQQLPLKEIRLSILTDTATNAQLLHKIAAGNYPQLQQLFWFISAIPAQSQAEVEANYQEIDSALLSLQEALINDQLPHFHRFILQNVSSQTEHRYLITLPIALQQRVEAFKHTVDTWDKKRQALIAEGQSTLRNTSSTETPSLNCLLQ